MLPITTFRTDFLGRRDEVDAVVGAVGRRSLVTVAGTGGLGKTRVAYRALDVLSSEYRERVWAVELADLRDPALIGHLLSLALDAPPPGEVFSPEALVATIGTEPGLLLLDNCEHLLDACAELIAALLRGCPGLRVLTTSRQPLGVIGEHVYVLPPLEQPDAVALFDARAGAALPGWVPTDAEQSDVADLCRALEGIPLAIELVASQVRAFPPRQLLLQVAEHAGELAVARGEATRRTSLEASIRWSHDLCTDPEQLLWHRLSVFAGGFSLDGARAACSGDGLAPADVLGALAGLVEKSVVLRAADGDRYRMLEQIRQFGSARLEETEDVEVWRGRHRDHYLALVLEFEAQWWGPGQQAWMERLYLERRNLAVALDFSAGSAAEAPCVLRMSGVLEHFFAATGGGGAAIQWLQRALQFGTGTDLETANALRVGSFIANLVGEAETSAQFHAALTAIAERTGEPRIRAFELYAESQLRTFQSDVDAGIRAAAAGLLLLQEIGDIGLEANLHFLYAMILGWADRPAEAAAEYERCLALLEPLGERWLTSYSHWGLGVDALLSGRVDAAVSLEQDALRVKLGFGDQLGIGLALEALAWAAAEQRRARQAAFLLGGAEAIWARIGMSVAAMPYLSRRRETAIATIHALLTAREYDDLVERGRRGPQDLVIGTALGEARVPEEATGQALTRREREVAELVADGRSNRAIADHLVISVRTVETHVENLLRKLGAGTRNDVGPALARRRAAVQ